MTDNSILSCLEDVLPEAFKDLQESGYTFKTQQRSVTGDLALRLNKTEPQTSSEYFLKPFDSHGALIESEIVDNLKLSVSSENITIIKSLNSLSKRRIIVFGDSSFRHGLHLLTPLFSEIIYFNGQLFRPELINLFRPDVVLTVNSEKFLSNIKNDCETEFWCTTNFYESRPTPKNEYSRRMLFHLKGL